ncbi:MAG TPA: hypothetical protein VNZ86_18350 [Bacteroidia bacterium]|jgi:hypothetical protein|nr:hypothetical protein [Bacteroidia bacterium]
MSNQILRNGFSCIAGISLLLFAVSCGNTTKKEDAPKDKTEAASVKKYTSKDGKFSVNFTAEPTVTDKTIQTAVGNIELHMFMMEKSATEAYVVGYSDYPSDLMKDSNRDSVLNGAKNGVVTNVNASITEEKKIKIEGNDGLFFKANSPQYYLTYKLFVVGNRLYQIGIMRDGSNASEESIKNFFETFELTK